jgi:microsomal dipeptidase-like Zn-dependent dipeptidase
MELNNQQIGFPITQELSELIREYTNTSDYSDVMAKTGYSHSMIRDLVYRKRSLTENNIQSIKELTIIALKNCANQIKNDRAKIKELKTYIPHEQIKAS